MSEIVLSCSGLGKTFRQGNYAVEVLKDIDFEVREGERVAIVGASGSGKSTFLHLLGGLDTPTAGSVSLQGKQFDTLSESERGILRNRVLGFVYQFHHLLPEFSALDNVAMPLMIRREKRERAHEAAMEILTRVGLAERVSHVPGELSGGERQRVALARALVTHPACVLADEPTGNLDSKTSQDVLGLLKVTGKCFHQTIVMITHNEEIAQMADRILQIEDGKIVSDSGLV